MSKQYNSIFTENMEKYQDPKMYDLQYEGYRNDVPMILEWAEKQGGPIVDLACGTGRVTIPLAKRGFQMVGVDLNEDMLGRAKEKSDSECLSSIQWLLQDCSQLRLDSVSPFIYMTGNSIQHFLTNESQDRLLQSVHDHLNEGGVFLFGTRFPKLKELALEEEEVVHYKDKKERRVKETHREVFDPIKQVLHCTSRREFFNDRNEVISVENDSISLRYVFPLEMERLLNDNGFSILHAYGAWDKEPLTEACDEMIYVCQKSKDN